MRREEFVNQKALQDYAEAHDLEYFWEGMNAFAERITMLAPGQYEIVEVRTSRGVTRALLFLKGSLRSEFEADRPIREALAIKRDRLRAKRAAKEKSRGRLQLRRAANSLTRICAADPDFGSPRLASYGPPVVAIAGLMAARISLSVFALNSSLYQLATSTSSRDAADARNVAPPSAEFHFWGRRREHELLEMFSCCVPTPRRAELQKAFRLDWSMAARRLPRRARFYYADYLMSGQLIHDDGIAATKSCCEVAG